MIILYILLAIVLLFIYLVFVAAMQVLLTFNSQKEDITITILWLYPLVKAVVSLENENFVLSVLLFKKQVYRKELMQGGRENTKRPFSLKLVKQMEPRDIHINAVYGFRDPSVTGIACGAINIAASYLDIASLEHNPDFMAEKSYINFSAAAKLNPGTTLVNLYRAYIHNSGR